MILISRHLFGKKWDEISSKFKVILSQLDFQIWNSELYIKTEKYKTEIKNFKRILKLACN